jgi:predicted HNH restriction endonuclease
MIAVLGQIPFLKWENYSLSIDVSALNRDFEVEIMTYATPQKRASRKEKDTEVLAQGTMNEIPPIIDLPESRDEEISFIEGNRRRVTHLRIERSSRLRELYLSNKSDPTICNMCTMDTSITYPWSRFLIEVHHLLPLGSLLRVNASATSLEDVVGVCPSCHKATHQFYKAWLDTAGLEDFRSEEEAREVYLEAKQNIVLN